MSLFIAERIEQIDVSVGNLSVILAPASEDRIFLEITLAKGSAVWVTRSNSASKEKGILLVGIGASFRVTDWLGAISAISEGTTRITGEIGYG